MINPVNRFFTWAAKVKRDKREYKSAQARIDALPEEYGYTYHKIEHYMWAHSGGDGMDVLAIMRDVADLFEEGAAQGKGVLAVTGDDVAGFADELLRTAKTWTGKRHDELNRDVHQMVRKVRE